ncbi:MAG: type II toxin-antitoxin system RelE/ParE family toxin [Cyclobacteriaceae bacterium]
MANYRLSNEAKADLIRIHHYGVWKFGMAQADKNFHSFLTVLTVLPNDHFHLKR